MKHPKTHRQRGLIYMLIRKVAARKKYFRIDNLVPPLSIEQAYDNVIGLMQRGEITKVKCEVVKRNGDFKLRCVYQATNALRKPELTNKHL